MVEVTRLKVERPDPVVALVKDESQIGPGDEFPDQSGKYDTQERGIPVDQGRGGASFAGVPKVRVIGWVVGHGAAGWIPHSFRSKRIQANPLFFELTGVT
jgi:hypothetical protein